MFLGTLCVCSYHVANSLCHCSARSTTWTVVNSAFMMSMSKMRSKERTATTKCMRFITILIVHEWLSLLEHKHLQLTTRQVSQPHIRTSYTHFHRNHSCNIGFIVIWATYPAHLNHVGSTTLTILCNMCKSQSSLLYTGKHLKLSSCHNSGGYRVLIKQDVCYSWAKNFHCRALFCHKIVCIVPQSFPRTVIQVVKLWLWTTAQ